MNSNYSANMLVLPRPNAQSCQSSCGSLGITDPTYKSLLSPRRSREKVREQIKDTTVLMLGGPTISLELDQQQLDGAVDLALQVFEDYAPREYFQYYVFHTMPGQSVYHLPPDVGMVRHVAYKPQGGTAFSGSDLGGSLPIEYFYPGGGGGGFGGMGLMDPNQPVWGRMGEWVLYKQYETMYSRISSNIGGWEWLGGLNDIKLYPIPYRVHPVVVHYLQKNADFRQITEAMREGALAYAMIMLGEIRSKIMNPPGPNGGVQLNGQAMLERGYKMKEDWEARLLTRYGDVLGPTMG